MIVKFNLNTIEDRYEALLKAKDILLNDGIIILKTDTLIGIVGYAFSKRANEKMRFIKNRDINIPIPILINSIQMAKTFVSSFSELHIQLMNTFWPGSLTLIFNKLNSLNINYTGNINSIGLRLPYHKTILSILNTVGPIICSSANIHNQSPLPTINDCIDIFGDSIDMYIDEDIDMFNFPSTVVSILDGYRYRILRDGCIKVDDIRFILSKCNSLEI